jgi:hypothetical protein
LATAPIEVPQKQKLLMRAWSTPQLASVRDQDALLAGPMSSLPKSPVKISFGRQKREDYAFIKV